MRAGATRIEILLRDLLAYTQVTSMQEVPEKADANEALAQALEGLASAISETGAQVKADSCPPCARTTPICSNFVRTL
jgi:light-regulated signal transduction histidine kinase (bacteriophytochrome)